MNHITQQKHYTEISATKGILIILMVIGHSGAPKWLAEPLSLVRMPCFFLISGFLFKEKYLDEIRNYVTRKVKGLYIPFIKWSFIFLLLHNLFYYLNIYSISYNINDYKHKIFQILTMTGSEQLLGGFWFLKELLYASIFSLFTFKLITSINKKLSIRVLLTTSLVFALFSIMYSYANFKIPTIGSKTLLATSYFIVGYAFHKINMIYTNINKRGIGIFLFTVFVISSLYVKGSMENKGISIIPYFAVSIIASVSTIYLTKYITGYLMKILDYVGKNTLYILIFHFLSFKIVSLFILMIENLPYTNLSTFPVLEDRNGFMWVIYTIIGVVVPLLIKQAMDKLSYSCKGISKRVI